MSESLECLIVEDLSIASHGRLLIAHLSLRLHPGIVLGASGPSGSGKTTLLRSLARLDSRYLGRIDAPDGRLAMVFQEPRLLPWATPAKMSGTLAGASAEESLLDATLVARTSCFVSTHALSCAFSSCLLVSRRDR